MKKFIYNNSDKNIKLHFKNIDVCTLFDAYIFNFFQINYIFYFF